MSMACCSMLQWTIHKILQLSIKKSFFSRRTIFTWGPALGFAMRPLCTNLKSVFTCSGTPAPRYSWCGWTTARLSWRTGASECSPQTPQDREDGGGQARQLLNFRLQHVLPLGLGVWGL